MHWAVPTVFLPTAVVLAALAPPAVAAVSDDALTIYIGRISSANAWHDLITAPTEAEFVDAYVAVGALSRVLSRHRDDRLSMELEGQVGYNFGDQSHWELNLLAGPRWHRFAWNDVITTTAAFGLGLSLAGERPEVEIELEGDTEKLLVYWMTELTFGPPRGNWAVSLRLHHRSGAFGLLADDGGMNAVALGVRRDF